MSMVKIDWKPTAKQLRQFGVIGLFAFAAIGAWVYFHPSHRLIVSMSESTAGRVAAVCAVLSAFCGIFAAAAPMVLKPLYIALMVVTFPIGLVISQVVLILVFYGVFTPIGLFFRAIGRDALHRKLLPQAETYWETREVVRDPKRYFRQF